MFKKTIIILILISSTYAKENQYQFNIAESTNSKKGETQGKKTVIMNGDIHKIIERLDYELYKLERENKNIEFAIVIKTIKYTELQNKITKKYNERFKPRKKNNK